MIIKRDFYYPPRNSNRRLHIYLPDDYEYSNERYPVVYMFDGHNLYYDEDATYGKSWGIKTFLDAWDKKLIIVGMECSHTGDERLSEYCPYRKRMFGHMIDGIGDATFQWIINDIKPMIDREYRTWAHREATAIAGSSMGGLMSLYGVIRYNNVFGKAACVSPSVFMNMKNLENEIKAADIHPDTRVYISWGEYEAGKAPHNGDPARDTREAHSAYKLERKLQERGAQTYVFFQREGRHCEADWEKQVPVFMNFLWK